MQKDDNTSQRYMQKDDNTPLANTDTAPLSYSVFSLVLTDAALITQGATKSRMEACFPRYD